MPQAQGPDGLPRHITRMWPKREKEILSGGSIFWVFKGVIQCRQKIVRFDEVFGEDGIRRCAIVLEPKLYRTVQAPKRPFQGWRYDALTRVLGKGDAIPAVGGVIRPGLLLELERGEA